MAHERESFCKYTKLAAESTTNTNPVFRRDFHEINLARIKFKKLGKHPTT